MEFYIKHPYKNAPIPISKDQIVFTSLDPKKAVIKVIFDRPELISLGSQSDPDNIIVKFSKDFVMNDKNGNSLVFNSGENKPNSIDFGVPLQTQVVKDSPQ
jgi:hypothetical protein